MVILRQPCFAKVQAAPAAQRNRRGAILVEAIVAFPILIIALMAIVEFGLISTHQSSLQLAARAGADAATQIALPAAGPIPDKILAAVDEVLACRGLTADCVRLEHNQGGTPVVLLDGAGASNPVAPAPADHPYVTVSVCIENTDLAPNLLQSFCIDMSGSLSQKSTTRCF